MRSLRRTILALALAALLSAGLLLGLWVIGVFVSDRFRWSQPISFVPRQFLVWPAGIAWCVFAGTSLAYVVFKPMGEGVPWRSERRGRSRFPRLLGKLRAITGVLVLLITAHLIGIEWRWPMNASRPPPTPTERLRIMHWNVGWSHPVEVADSIIARQADLVIVVNPLTRTDLAWDFTTLGQRMGEGTRVIRDWPINVLSRFPIRRWGVTELGFTARVNVLEEIRSTTESTPIDPGHAMFVELEAGPPMSRPLVVWIIDLPSDPLLHRAALARQARQRIEAWIGPNAQRFPEPDILIGDFNIPARSASLSQLRRRPGYLMQDAHALAGVGPDGTYQLSGLRRSVWLHIDQCFVKPGLNVARYSIQDGGDTRHLMQVVDLVP